MKRLRQPAVFTRTRTRTVSICTLALVIFAGSCDLFSYKRPFDDAYYEDNFIGSIGFDRFAATAGTDPLNPPTGQWDFAYRYDKWDGIDYMSLVAETDTDYATAGGPGYSGDLPDGLSPTAPVYRLELKNMVSGGDFETDAGTWTLGGTTSKVNRISDGGINNWTIQADLAGGETNSFSLDPVKGLMLAGGEYVADFRWKGETPAISSESFFRMNDEVVNFLFNDITGHANMQFDSRDTNAIQFHVTWLGMIDDLTVRKANAKHQLRLLLRRAETKPDLEDFLYKFSFWVRPDPKVGANTSPYPLDRLGVKMYPTAVSTLSQKSDPDYGYAAGSGWVKMTTKIENGNLQMNRGTKQPVLELIVDLDDSLPGRVLIAQPELRAYPDGY